MLYNFDKKGENREVLGRAKTQMKETLRKNSKGYILIGAVFLAGVVLSLLLNVSASYKEEMNLYINDFVANVKNYSIDSVKTFRLSMGGYAKTVLLLFVMSICAIGNYGILFFTFVKGFSYGVFFSGLLNALEVKKTIFFSCVVLLHIIVSAPCIASYTLYCFKNSCAIIDGGKRLKGRVFSSLLFAVLTVSILCISALIQAYIEPVLIRISTL